MGLDLWFRNEKEERINMRKANEIFKFFDDRIGEYGIDNCVEYVIPPEMAEELVELCKQVCSTPEKAGDLLPTQEGFFFGSTDYDDEYFKSVERVGRELEEFIKKSNIIIFGCWW